MTMIDEVVVGIVGCRENGIGFGGEGAAFLAGFDDALQDYIVVAAYEARTSGAEVRLWHRNKSHSS